MILKTARNTSHKIFSRWEKDHHEYIGRVRVRVREIEEMIKAVSMTAFDIHATNQDIRTSCLASYHSRIKPLRRVLARHRSRPTKVEIIRSRIAPIPLD